MDGACHGELSPAAVTALSHRLGLLRDSLGSAAGGARARRAVSEAAAKEVAGAEQCLKRIEEVRVISRVKG